MCSVFLSSRLCLISHLAFPLCAALVIVFLCSALAFDIQTPKALAALQINCISQQCFPSVSLCLFLSTLSCLSRRPHTGDGLKGSVSVICLRLNLISVRLLCIWRVCDGVGDDSESVSAARSMRVLWHLAFSCLCWHFHYIQYAVTDVVSNISKTWLWGHTHLYWNYIFCSPFISWWECSYFF